MSEPGDRTAIKLARIESQLTDLMDGVRRIAESVGLLAESFETISKRLTVVEERLSDVVDAMDDTDQEPHARLIEAMDQLTQALSRSVPR